MKEKKIYQRNCPQCGKLQTYTRKAGLERAIKENRVCFACSMKNTRLSPEEKQKRKQEEKERYREYHRIYIKEYRKNNPEKRQRDKEYNKKYYQREDIKLKNKLRLREYRKTEKYENYRKTIYNPRKKEYMKEKRKDPLYRVSSNLSRSMSGSLRAKNLSKNKRHWENIVGYTIYELKEHLEKYFLPGMSWDNYGKNGWHIDHVIPKKFFVFNSIEDVEFRYCWSLDNLRPLWEKDNLEKNDKIIYKYLI